MKIPETAISAFQLKSTSEQCGSSFYHNLMIYESPIFPGLKFMECDLNGEPSPYITVYDVASKRVWQFTAEFLEVINATQIAELIGKA